MATQKQMIEELKASGVQFIKGFSQGRDMYKAMLDGQEIDRARNIGELVENVHRKFR